MGSPARPGIGSRRKYKAEDFKSRAELDAFIRKEVGLDFSKNVEQDVVIEGTQEELDRLMLTTKTTVFGVHVKLK